VKSLARKICVVFLKILPEKLRGFFFREIFIQMDPEMKNYHRKLFSMASMENSLKIWLDNTGTCPSAVLDIGAYQGMWTRMALKIFKNSKFYLIEAQKEKEHYYEKLQKENEGKIEYELSLLGSEAKDSVDFTEFESGSTLFDSAAPGVKNTIKLPMKTLDQVVEEKNWGKIPFLKIDVQGAELEILKGAPETLKHVQAILMEVTLFGWIVGAPRINEVLLFMEERGFVVYDICSLMRRPLDDALIETDLLFVRRNSDLFENLEYGDPRKQRDIEWEKFTFN